MQGCERFVGYWRWPALDERNPPLSNAGAGATNGGLRDRPFTYWDMYTLHRYQRLTDAMLASVEADARSSLEAAEAALPLSPPDSKELVQMTRISAERRLWLATSARHLLKARELKKGGDAASLHSSHKLSPSTLLSQKVTVATRLS